MQSIWVKILLRHGKISSVISLQDKFTLKIAGSFTSSKRENHFQAAAMKNSKQSAYFVLPAIHQISTRNTSNESCSKNPVKEIINTETENAYADLSNLPEIPHAAPETVYAISQSVSITEEPSLSAIGLGGLSPVGLIQHSMEFLHASCNLPWWAAIMIGTLTVRTLIFPLMIVAQRNATKMNNYKPELQQLILKITEARKSGNSVRVEHNTQEMIQFMKEKQMNPFKNVIIPLAQTPLFFSFVVALRGMTNSPVESMREGGILWFSDLTIADPTFILPLITIATFFLTIELGTRELSAQNKMVVRNVLRALPIVVFPLMLHFPAAILIYWVCCNFLSILQTLILEIPAVRDYFKIEKMITHQPKPVPLENTATVKETKDGEERNKIEKGIAEEEFFDEMFAKVGKNTHLKSFEHNSTERQRSASIEAKNH